jgi:hypothetical protein
VWDRVVSLGNEFKEETSPNFTPKYVKDMADGVLKNNKL